MSASEIVITEEWNANDYSNLITISAAAISSVLLVIFKSRCTKIDFCCGLWKCIRDPLDPEEMKKLEEEKKKAEKPVSEANIERDNNQVIKNVVKDNNPEASDTEIEALIEDLKEKAIGGDEEK
tara:strand:- start:1054 stop:1425 length:372 start_codon:yes stop_codon:yes gene_type:complete